ncbi:patatin-like phospholipase family protein, partial [Vibrio parahaemolyticus V-223/04]
SKSKPCKNTMFTFVPMSAKWKPSSSTKCLGLFNLVMTSPEKWSRS